MAGLEHGAKIVIKQPTKGDSVMAKKKNELNELDLQKQVESLAYIRPKPSAGGATYVSVTKVIETEENYVVRSCKVYSPEQLQEGLESGDLNLQQSETVESYVFVIDESGARVAELEKDGGIGPGHTVTIEVR